MRPAVGTARLPCHTPMPQVTRLEQRVFVRSDAFHGRIHRKSKGKSQGTGIPRLGALVGRGRSHRTSSPSGHQFVTAKVRGSESPVAARASGSVVSARSRPLAFGAATRRNSTNLPSFAATAVTARQGRSGPAPAVSRVTQVSLTSTKWRTSRTASCSSNTCSRLECWRANSTMRDRIYRCADRVLPAVAGPPAGLAR